MDTDSPPPPPGSGGAATVASGQAPAAYSGIDAAVAEANIEGMLQRSPSDLMVNEREVRHVAAPGGRPRPAALRLVAVRPGRGSAAAPASPPPPRPSARWSDKQAAIP